MASWMMKNPVIIHTIAVKPAQLLIALVCTFISIEQF